MMIAGVLLGGTQFSLGSDVGSVEGGEPEENRTVSLYEHLAPATVFLSVSYESAHPLAAPPTTGVGSGFIVDGQGAVLTNAHVVDGASSIAATLYNGQRVTAELLALDPVADIAVLRLPPLDRKLEPVKLGDSSHLHVGQMTLVVGSPFGLGFTLTKGIVSGLGPLAGTAGPAYPRLIQTTAPINPGNSGGPLVDSKGRVIGIIAAALVGAQNIGFAIPINTAKQVLAELKERGKIARPWLGVTGKFLTEEIMRLFALPLTSGLLVEDLEDGSPAAEAGLRTGVMHVVVEGVPWILGGDIIVAVEGQSVRTADTFVEVIKTLRTGQRIQIEFIRNGEHLSKSVVVSERPPGSLKPKSSPDSQVAGVLSQGLPWRDEWSLFAF